MTAAARPPSPWATWERLVAQARAADTERELLFIMANEGFSLVPYRSALVFLGGAATPRLSAASGLNEVDRRSPFGAWAEQVVAHLLPRRAEGSRFGPADVPAELASTWAEYWPAQVHLHALPGRDGEPQGAVLYVSDEAWPEPVDRMLGSVHQVYGLCLDQLRLRHTAWRGARGRLLGATPGGRRVRLALAVALLAALFVPVKQFVIAPAEIISLDSTTVTAPVEGIVAEMVAKPNQPVRRGDVLLRLEDTAIRNRLASAAQGLEVARAEYLAGAHRALVSADNAAEAGVLKGRIQERGAEVSYLREQLSMLEVRASRDGIAVYGQESDWVGKPVSPGLRIMELADATQVGVQVWVPVADAINMTAGEPLQVLLYADPANPLEARIAQASYQPTKSPDGVVAYRVRALLSPQQQAVRLGLRGSAKINGEWVPLGYFLLRRPLAAGRQWLGV